MKKKILFILILFLVLSIFSIFVFKKDKDDDSENKTVKNVKTQIVENNKIEKVSQFSSIVSGEEETAIHSKMSGYVIDIRKKEGDKVYKGEILAVLDGNEILTQVSAVQDNVDSIKLVVDEADDYYDQAVDEAKSDLKKMKKNMMF